MGIKRGKDMIVDLPHEPDDLGWLIEFTERIGRSHEKGKRMVVPKHTIKFKHYQELIERNPVLFKTWYQLEDEKTKYIISAKP